MKFSEYFEIQPTADDWFDPVLFTDTRLFVDPFRIFVDASPGWSQAHSRLISFFNMVLKLIARSGGNPASAHWRKAERLLMFPEPPEFCLGYSDGLPMGAGSAEILRDRMMAAADAAIRLGVTSIEHFEELTLFEAQIGADRISDIVCNVLKDSFIDYTQEVAARYSIPVKLVGIRHTSWSERFERWDDATVELPQNPYTGKGVLLTPQRFLRQLPTVDPNEFWTWAWTNENEAIRGDFNYEIASNVDAKEIARFARMNPHLGHRYVKYLESNPKNPYDFRSDPAGEVGWYTAGASITKATPLAFVPQEPAEFSQFIETIIDAFVQNVENQDGWLLLWHESTPRNERIVQALFRSVVIHYCRANGIDLSGEPNAGRGPVDFKFSQGWHRRALVEVKLTSNSKYWGGLQKQTVQYLKSEEVRAAFYLSVNLADNDYLENRRSKVLEVAERVSREADKEIRVKFVDARRKPSASKL